MPDEMRDKAKAGIEAHLECRCCDCPYVTEPAGCINRMLKDAKDAIDALTIVEEGVRKIRDGLRGEG